MLLSLEELFIIHTGGGRAENVHQEGGDNEDSTEVAKAEHSQDDSPLLELYPVHCFDHINSAFLYFVLCFINSFSNNTCLLDNIFFTSSSQHIQNINHLFCIS